MSCKVPLFRPIFLPRCHAREEQADHVRYLRPVYQAPDQQQPALVLATGAAVEGGQRVTVAQVAAKFRRVKVEKAEPLLLTLSTVSLLRHTTEGTFVT